MGDDLAESADPPHSLDLPAGRGSAYGKFVMAALGGIPWVGGLIAAGAALHTERSQGRVNKQIEDWLQAHEDHLRELYTSLSEVVARVEELGPAAQARLQDDDYLGIVRKGYRVWDKAETAQKRQHVQRLLTNAAGTSLVDDDIVRLFLDWIDRYHEAHFEIIRAVYKNPGITLLGIWNEMGRTGPLPRENSSDADLFRMLIHDLSTGRVVRQERETDEAGRFLKKTTRGHRAPSSPFTKSSFDDVDGHELSELGREFVHYVLQDAVSRIGDD